MKQLLALTLPESGKEVIIALVAVGFLLIACALVLIMLSLRKERAGSLVEPVKPAEPVKEPEPAPAIKEPVKKVPAVKEPVKKPPVRQEVKVHEVRTLMQDKEAIELIEESEKNSDRTKGGIVNIDTLSEYFTEGERVTLEEMKSRIPVISKKTTYIKVLARGKLDKALEVEADEFSLDAVKMIALMGGKAIRTRKKQSRG